MKKQEFLQEFFNELGAISENERQQITDYYEELICDGSEQGLTEEECVAKFGSPKEAAEKFKEEYVPESTALSDSNQVFCPQEAGIHTLDLSAENVHITASESDSPFFQIFFNPNPEYDSVESYCENGTWYFRHKKLKKLRFFLSVVLAKRFETITVNVPKNFIGSLIIKTSNAKITLSDAQNLKLTNLTSSNCPIEIKNIKSEHCQASTSNSRITMENISGDTLIAHTGNSPIIANHVLYTSQKLQTSNSSIRLTDTSGDTLDASTSNSGINAQNCTFPSNLTLCTSNGSISVNNIVSDNISLSTSNSSITGQVTGDMRQYATVGKTSNSSCNIPTLSYPDQTKHFSARTSNGRINVNFVIPSEN